MKRFEAKLAALHAKPQATGLRARIDANRQRRTSEYLTASRARLAELGLRRRERKSRRQETEAERLQAQPSATAAGQPGRRASGLTSIFAGFGIVMFVLILILVVASKFR